MAEAHTADDNVIDFGDGKRQRLVKALVIEFPDEAAAEAGSSKALPERDLFKSIAPMLVPLPFDKSYLARLPAHSGELAAAIDAMANNIGGYGHRFACRVTDAEQEKALEAEIRRERVWLVNFFQRVALGESWHSLRKRTRKDIETTGEGFTEVIRDRRGRIKNLGYLASEQMRLCWEDLEFTQIEVPTPTLQEDGSWTLETIDQPRRLRRFVQGQSVLATAEGAPSSRIRFFKSFGDKRVLHNRTGVYMTEAEAATAGPDGGPLPEDYRANEVIHWRIPCSYSPHGLPRYMGNLLAVLGVRGAEEVNYATLKNNNIPSLALLVSNGRLTGATVKRITEFIEKKVKGNDNRSSVLIIEGEGEFEGEESGQVKIDMKPLNAAQVTDAMFSKYMQDGRSAIRQSFRLPPIFVGSTQDYNRATADASRQLADEQVFAPERTEEDWTINTVLADAGVRFHEFQSRTPNVTDNRELVTMLTSAERTGAITPRIARAVVEDVFPTAAELPSSKIDQDTPYSLQLAEAMKNQASPTEPNQNGPPALPAMKRDPGQRDDGPVDPFVELWKALDESDRLVAELRLWGHRGRDGEPDEA